MIYRIPLRGLPPAPRPAAARLRSCSSREKRSSRAERGARTEAGARSRLLGQSRKAAAAAAAGRDTSVLTSEQSRTGDVAHITLEARTSGRWGQTGDRLGTDWGQTGDRPGTDWRQTGDRLGTGWGRTRDRPGTDWRQTGDRLRTDWGQTGVRLGTDWRQTGDRLGTDWGQTGARLGTDWGQTGARLRNRLGPDWGHTGVLDNKFGSNPSVTINRSKGHRCSQRYLPVTRNLTQGCARNRKLTLSNTLPPPPERFCRRVLRNNSCVQIYLGHPSFCHLSPPVHEGTAAAAAAASDCEEIGPLPPGPLPPGPPAPGSPAPGSLAPGSPCPRVPLPPGPWPPGPPAPGSLPRVPLAPGPRLTPGTRSRHASRLQPLIPRRGGKANKSKIRSLRIKRRGEMPLFPEGRAMKEDEMKGHYRLPMLSSVESPSRNQNKSFPLFQIFVCARRSPLPTANTSFWYFCTPAPPRFSSGLMTSSLMLSHYFTINTFAFEESVRSALGSCRQTRAELLYTDMSK
ncbi:hypothetical protein N1851_026522 [Merluccius polli]|uniref:Uncharacterized protein n=1 Tax=Merluccius polli TaxID=89951 RepID=A0AA47MC01_MERPO|nr:hypothetical protein N1851_026522 [Merluccius polli]